MVYVKTNNELYHHGIPNQKWGVRNGPPYPLGWKDHSKAEQKAMSKEEKYRAKAVDRVSSRYGSVAREYDRRGAALEKKRQKMDERFYNRLEKYDRAGNEKKAIKLTDKYQKKYDEISNKIGLTDIGKNLCNNLLEKEIGHIQDLDKLNKDRRKRGRTIAMSMLNSGWATSVARTSYNTQIPIVINKKESRLTKDDVRSAARYAGANEFKDSDKVIDRVIGKTTNYKGKRIRKSI